MNTRQLEKALRQRVRGEVRFDAGARALYATDGSNYRQVPLGVVLPRDVEDILAAVATCREFEAPLLARGGGTSLAGQCCNVAVVLDTSKYVNRILEIDPDRRIARVEPGCVLDRLNQTALPLGLTFAPDPSTHSRCTLGGMIGNNSCGAHSLMGGNAVDNVEELDIVTYGGLRMRARQTPDDELSAIIQKGGQRGEMYSALRSIRDRYGDLVRARYPKIPRRISGYNLDQLLPENSFHVARSLVGTEGTCATVLEARLRLVPAPRFRVLLAMGFPDLPASADAVEVILRHKPIALEGAERPMLAMLEALPTMRDRFALLPEGDGLLLVEFGAPSVHEARDLARSLMAEFERQPRPPSMRLIENPRQARSIWEIREAALGAASRDANGREFWGGWEDAAVPPARLGDYLRAFYPLFRAHKYHGSLYGHFGQGCIHSRFDFDFRSPEGLRKYRSFIEEAADLVIRFGGSPSGEHGDGQARAELYPKVFGPELVEGFREFKRIWDPLGKMNPGKLVDPNRMDENLRAGMGYKPWRPRTQFKFPQDQHSFERAIARCVGVGKCRREAGETMCPSYRVTHEEEHSTRGRARLLWEMLNGEVITGKWRDPHVRHALDLCLACKGCKAECPVGVDMAAYKAEFLSHYYAYRLRPLAAYAFGMVFAWARLGSHFPRLVNFATQSNTLSRLMKGLAGIAPQRSIPSLADQTFRSWFRKRTVRNAGGRPVILWPDTFNNYFTPQVAQAAVEVLEAAGFSPMLPSKPLCCGRPLYDYGMIGVARWKLRQALATLAPHIQAGVPVVGLEPSCVAVLRDELLNLFPKDPNAQALARQTFLLGEFLTSQGFAPPRLAGKALLHGHCHQKALSGMNGDLDLLVKAGLDARLIDSGCCGMAGGFGYEKEHYDVSVKAGELVLLPAVREVDTETLIVADGFSCRGQITQGTGRPAMHLAEVLQLALHCHDADPCR